MSEQVVQTDTIIPEERKILKLRIKPKIDQSWNIYDIATKCTPPSWEEAFKNADTELQHINKLLTKFEEKNSISFPNRADIFKAFELTRLDKIRAVFVSPEPYYATDFDGSPLATGLALSVKKSSTIPRNLLSLFSLMERQIPDFKTPNHGDLTEWAKNGILLLNISLTVKAGEPKKHSELWTGFTMKIIEQIMNKSKHIPFFFFGKDCNKISSFISGSCPIYSCNNFGTMGEDMGSAFVEMNKFLEKHKLEKINFKLT